MEHLSSGRLYLGGYATLVGITRYLTANLVLPVSLAPVLAVTPPVTLAKSVPLAPMGPGISGSVAALLYPLAGLKGGAEAHMLVRAAITVVSATCGLTSLLPAPTVNPVQPVRAPANR
jgi:hypothetical protein